MHQIVRYLEIPLYRVQRLLNFGADNFLPTNSSHVLLFPFLEAYCSSELLMKINWYKEKWCAEVSMYKKLDSEVNSLNGKA